MKKLRFWAFTFLLIFLLFLPTRVATAQLIATFEGHTDNVWSVAFSPDGQMLASGSFDQTVRLWDVETEQLLYILTGHTGEVNSVAFSLDGDTLASGSWDGTIRLWNPNTGKLKRTLTDNMGGVGSVAFSPNRKMLASGSADAKIRLWDTTTWQVQRTLTDHTLVVDSVAFSPDGGMLASGSRDQTIRLWNPNTGKPLHMLTGHTGDITRMVFSPDGSTLASGGRDGTVILWNPQTGGRKNTLTVPIGEHNPVTFSPDGETLAIGNRGISLWDTDTEEYKIPLIGGIGSVVSVVFSPDGQMVASGSTDNLVHLLESTSLEGPFVNVPFDINNIPEPVPPPAAVRDFFELDPFYQQWINVRGFPVLASAEVSPYSVKEAAWTIGHMVGHRPDILRVLAQDRQRLSVLSINESMGDLPESERINSRIRFFVAHMRDTVCSPCAATLASEENLLCNSCSYSFLIHEFTHIIHHELNTIDPTFDSRLKIAYDAAIAKGLWKDTYAASNRGEYFAEAVGSWFHAPEFNNPVKTRDALKAYDPTLALLITEIFGDGPWRYTPFATRTHLPHLQGFNRQEAFRLDGPPLWTTRQQELREQMQDPDSDGGGKWVNIQLYHPSQLPSLIASTTRGGGTEIISMNLTGHEISFYFIGADGMWHFHWRSTPNKMTEFSTYAGAIWLIQDHNGEDLAVFRAEEKVGRVLISPAIFETDSDGTNGDINGDGVVNVLDLVVIASELGNAGANLTVDVNRDGVVNVLDLILVAGMFDGAAAAPSVQPQVPETLTAVEVQGWLTDAGALEIKDLIMKRGIMVLEQLLISLTPKETELLPNYPNPFNPETWIPYRLAEDAFVTLTIYDLSGQVIRTLDVGHRIASAYESQSKAIHWDGRNNLGEQAASGVYFYTLTAGDFSATRKMLILK